MRLNIQRLSAEGAGEEYARKLDERIEERLSGDNLTAVWRTVHEEISTTATEVLGTTRTTQRNGWFDAECQRATDEKNRARSRMLTAATRQNMQRYGELRTVEKKLHRRKKREHDERILAQAEGSFARNDARKFYKTINSTSNKSFLTPAMIDDRQGNVVTDR